MLYYGDDLDIVFHIQWFSYTGSDHKERKPWHWKNCTISLEKTLDDSIRFIVKRKKIVSLPEIQNHVGIKNKNTNLFHYVFIH